jgi:hypothetical protein
VLQFFDLRATGNVLLWFVAAVVLHDFLLLPFYSGLDRAAQAAAGSAVNYVRVPAGLSGLLLLVYFPLILGLSDRNYFAATGHHLKGYARNWLEITAVLFAASVLLYAIRVLRARR